MLQNRRSNAGNFRPWLSQAQTSPPLLLQRHRGWAISRHGQRVPQPRVWSQVLLSELKAHLLMLQNLRPPVVPRTYQHPAKYEFIYHLFTATFKSCQFYKEKLSATAIGMSLTMSRRKMSDPKIPVWDDTNMPYFMESLILCYSVCYPYYSQN